MKISTPSVTARKTKRTKKTANFTQRNFVDRHSLDSFELRFHSAVVEPTYASAQITISGDQRIAHLDLQVFDQRSYDRAQKTLREMTDGLVTLSSRLAESWPVMKVAIATEMAERKAHYAGIKRATAAVITKPRISQPVVAKKPARVKVVTEKPAKVFAKLMAVVSAPKMKKATGRPLRMIKAIAA